MQSEEKRFCPWYPLAEATDHAPGSPGVFQVKIQRGLIDYPRGKSAMIHYAFASDLQREIATWAAGQGADAAGWVCRHLAGDAAAMELEYRTLISRFATRFGAPPTLPTTRT